MRLTTEVKIPDAPFRLLPGASTVSIGSCFADIITDKLSQNRFDVLKNPFGTLYNPITISQNIYKAVTESKWENNDLFYYDQSYYPLSHASSFKNSDDIKCLERLTQTGQELRKKLEHSNLLIITLGTAWCYHLKEDNSIVGNCHKLPNHLFKRKLLSPQQIIDSLSQLINLLTEKYPDLQLLFTVSPVRHVRDSMIDNSRSKGALLYAMGELCSLYSGIYYFPSYEILMDELRDYRFYDETLTQPSKIAREIIWEKLSETIFDEKTIQFIKEYRKIHTALNHKINIESDNSTFARRSLDRVKMVQTKFKSVNLSVELLYFSKLLEESKK